MADEDETKELRESIERLEAKNKELVAELRKAKGTTNEEAARLAAELDDARAANVKLEAALKKAESGLAAAQKDAGEKLAAKSARIQALLRDDGLNRGLIEAGVKKEFLGPVAAYLRDRIEVDEEKGEAFSTVGGARRTIAEYLKEWAASDEGKNFVAAPANAGAGAAGGAGKPAGKTMKLSEFSALAPKDQAAFMTAGGTLNE